MNLVIIMGPQAVGKMTVGQELVKLTDFKLFHNHISIEAVINIFQYSTTEGKYVVNKFREAVFETAAKSDIEGALIFTFVWAFDMESDSVYVKELTNLFKQNNKKVYIVELEADYDERFNRNVTENRLLHKPSKREPENLERFVNMEKKYRLNSLPGEDFLPDSLTENEYIKINNTNLEAKDVAKIICEKFNF